MKKAALTLLIAILLIPLVFGLALGFWPVAEDKPQVGEGGHAGDPNPPTRADVRGSGQIITVNPGDSIQAAVDLAQPGDTVRVLPGAYHEEVLVQTESLTLEGVADGDQRAVLDGEGKLTTAIIGVGDYFTITGFKIVNYTSNGAQTQSVTGAIFRDLITDKTGDYGIFPILSSDVLVENCIVSGAIDTGIYVGQSKGIVVRQSETFANVSGIEIENSVDALVEENYTHDNTAGILVFVLPGKTATEGADTRVVNNRIENNNLKNFARPEMTVALVPPGTGLLIISADTTEVTGNTFKDNKSLSVGIVAVTDFPNFFNQDKWDIPVLPENNWIHNNTYIHNGYDPDPGVIDAGFKGRDLLWSTAGDGNRWDETGATMYPEPLPSSKWPAFARRAFWRIINFLAHL